MVVRARHFDGIDPSDRMHLPVDLKHRREPKVIIHSESDVDDWHSEWLGDPAADPLADVSGQAVNWEAMPSEAATQAWNDLDEWVNWLRRTYGLSPAVVPPMWHRHPELVWELSALHTYWVASYSWDALPSAPLHWHRDFAEARVRLREWVAACGTKLDRDRPTRRVAWPGELQTDPEPELLVVDRAADFRLFVADDVATRRDRERDTE